jgi:hypothetical protein
LLKPLLVPPDRIRDIDCRDEIGIRAQLRREGFCRQTAQKRCHYREGKTQDGQWPGKPVPGPRLRQAQAGHESAEAREESRSAEITPEEARQRIRTRDGSFRRHHLQALVQRVEVGADEIRIKGSKTQLLQILAASGEGHGVETAAHGVRGFI